MLETTQIQAQPARSGGSRLHEWNNRTRPILRYDLPASLVVFLVALPLFPWYSGGLRRACPCRADCGGDRRHRYRRAGWLATTSQRLRAAHVTAQPYNWKR
jgi:hypothetical protein